VLFIELADMAEIPDLGALRRLFRRPALALIQEYKVPIETRLESDPLQTLADAKTADAGKTLAALYGAPRQPVVLTTKNRDEAEALVFAIWSQQWPRLRRGFRFSTASFADRGRGGPAFDLQVSPEANRRAWQRAGEYLMLGSAGAVDDLPKPDGQPGMRAALDDLRTPDVRGFRSFLRSYGADVNNPRAAFLRLASAFDRIVLRPPADWLVALESIGQTFADPSEAILLKEELISPRDRSETQPADDRDLATISFLLTSHRAGPYSGLAINFSRLGHRLWAGRKKEVLGLLAQLVRQPEQPLSTAFAVEVANAVRPSEIRIISEETPELLTLFFTRRPTLAFHTEVWALPANTQWRIYEVLDRLNLDAKDWCEIIAAMVVTGTDVAVRTAVEKAGSYAMEGALRWLDSKVARERLPSQLWRDALAGPATAYLQLATASSPSALALCACLLEPGVAARVLSATRLDVQELARTPIESLPAPLRTPAAFLLVTLGLRADGADGVNLIARGFFPVHKALASDNYSSDSWRLLSPELPHLGFWREWDRCEKLRRAVRKRFSSSLLPMATALLKVAASQAERDIVKQLGNGEGYLVSNLDTPLL
jgi:hypothetical protein